VGLVTAVESATVALGEELRKAEFGRYLRENHPSRRGVDVPFQSLATYELSGGSAIRRALAVVSLAQRAGEQLEWTQADEDDVQWITGAWQAMKRIAGKCWAPIGAETRRLVIDEDDLLPDETEYLHGTRESGRGPWLRFAGLDAPSVDALITELVDACRNTPAYAAAAEQARCVDENRALKSQASTKRQLILRGLSFRGQEMIGEAKRRRRSVVQSAYDSAGEELQAFADAIRAYNELVNHVIWAILGLAESSETATLDRGIDLIRARRRPRSLWADFAMLDPPDRLVISHPPAPFILALETPVDGLYISVGNTIRWSGRELIEVHARRVRDLEAAGSKVAW